MRYDAILYDFDGTLVDSIPMIVKSFEMTFEAVLGVKKDPEELKKTIGLPLWTAFKKYDEPTQKVLLETYRRVNENLLETEIKHFPGVDDMLSMVKQSGLPQGVVTSKGKDAALFTMNQFNMARFFEVFVSRDDTIEHKPNPEPLIFAAKQLGISDMSKIVYVGDSVHDIICAHAAGSASAAVGWTRMPREDLKALNPTYWLETPEQISCILNDGTL